MSTVIESALSIAKHGFYTCAEVGVEPVLESFVLNTLEMAHEDDPSITEDQVRQYITQQWPSIVTELGV